MKFRIGCFSFDSAKRIRPSTWAAKLVSPDGRMVNLIYAGAGPFSFCWSRIVKSGKPGHFWMFPHAPKIYGPCRWTGVPMSESN